MQLAFLSLLISACASLMAVEYAWVEGEAPATVPEALGQADFPQDQVKVGAGWGNTAVMSQGRVLNLTLDESAATRAVPEDGLTFGYDLAITSGGKQEVWGRIGYEWVRSPMRWRIAGGAWQDLGAEQATVDVMPIQTWNELAWIRFGEAELPAGTVRIEVNWPRTMRLKKRSNRILGMLDAICIAAPGVFQPSGPWQPGQDHRGEAEQAAGRNVFRMPDPDGPARASIALTGAWQMANWDEHDAVPAGRLGPVERLPELESLRWFAYRVPGDRNAQRPDFAFHHRFIARCRVEVPAAHTGRSFLLDFQRFGTIASVFVNGRYCGFSKAHSTAWQVDVTPAVRPGAVNDIIVVFKDRYYSLNWDAEPHGWRGCWNQPQHLLSENQGVAAHHELAVAADAAAGITEPVALVSAGPAYISDVFVKPSVARRELALDVTISNPGAARTVSLACAAVPWSRDGAAGTPAKTMAGLDVALAAGETRTVTLCEGWADARLWWPDDVHLYQLVARLSAGGAPVDVSATRFGFREWTWDSHVFRLNGVKWQSWADIECNNDPRKLVANRGRTGCNMLRLWTNGGLAGMTRRETLDYCDENGVLVRDSGVFDGQAANYGHGLCEEVVVDGKKVRRAKQALFDNWKVQLEAWVRAERNHASVFIWSVENEVTYINALNLGMMAAVEPAIGDAVRSAVLRTDPTRPAMVDGGNALADESLPVNGAHYTEFYASDWRDLPDCTYSRDQWYDKDHRSRGAWRFVPGRPIMAGEVFFADGYTTDQLATIGGDRCFIGMGETRAARGLLARIFSEGWRWGEVASWHFWIGGGAFDYHRAWQPVAVLSRQWNSTFAPGQQVSRTLKVFNNTSSSEPITAAWELHLGGTRVAGGSSELALAPGTDREWPVSFTIPPVRSPVAGSLVLSARRGGAEVYRDQRDIRILVPSLLPKPALAAQELVVHDPKGAVIAWLAGRGIPHTVAAGLDDIPASAKVLVIGPDAIPRERAGDTLWYGRATAGLKVLVLDQRHPLRYRALPADLEPLEAKPSYWAELQAAAAGVEPELRGRFGFAEDLGHPVLAGLTQADFFTWGADHVMYRNPYRKGTHGFRSLLQCEQRLACTALAECPAGDGLLMLCQLAIGEKLATEAVAQQVFGQLLGYVAGYVPVHRGIQAVLPADSQGAKMLAGIGVQHQLVADAATALRSDGIAVVEATPANLADLAGRAEAVRAWCGKGNWLMLMGLTPEGLAGFNTLVQWQHVLRPFGTERVLLSSPVDPLAVGLTQRDVVLDTGNKMYPWMALLKPDADQFAWVVDHTDIAPFCTFPSPVELGKKSDTDPGADHWPRNMVNGFTSDDNWSFCYTIVMDQGHQKRWTLTLPREEEVVAFRIRPSSLYHPITRMNLYFDDDPVPVPADLRIEAVEQEVAIPSRKARKVTMEVAAWAQRGTADIVVIDNLWLMVKRPDDYLRRVKPLLNVGGLVRYDVGRGGIVLNQLRLLANEVNPANGEKKRNVCKTLLANMGAVFAGERTVLAGGRLAYAPVRIPDQRFNAYVRADKQPAWFKGPGDLSGLPVGEQTFGGVRYLLPDFSTSPVPSVFMLRGHESTVKAERIEGIAVQATADALFFLHTCHANPRQVGAYEQAAARARERREAAPEPPAVMSYRVNYADGSTVEVPVRYGREVGGWLERAPGSMPNAAVAWMGPLPGAPAGGQAVVYAMQWTNPRPGAEIATVDLVAGDAGWGAMAVFAITAATAMR